MTPPRTTRSRPSRSTPAPSPTRPPAPCRPRSTRPRPTPRTESTARGAATTTPGASTRPATGSSGRSRPSRREHTESPSPALQNPLELGADIVFHSATKYLGGHSDTILGIAVTRDEALAERLHFLQNAMGAVPGPLDCFLVLRGLRTLHLRVERHVANATAVARFLAGRPDVARVFYPGLADGPHAHPGASLVGDGRQMRGGGGMGSVLRPDDEQGGRDGG